MALLHAVLYATAPLVALTNPLAEIPMFLGIVSRQTPSQMRRSALKVAIGVWLILSISALGGIHILALFGVQLAAFRAAGGALLVVMGFEMVQSREPTIHTSQRDPDDAEDALWVPLTMPMLAGPGAIAVTMSLTLREAPLLGFIPVATLIATAISGSVVYGTLTLASHIGAGLRGRGTRILTRFSGLILVAIGFQMGFTGIAEFFSIG